MFSSKTPTKKTKTKRPKRFDFLVQFLTTIAILSLFGSCQNLNRQEDVGKPSEATSPFESYLQKSDSNNRSLSDRFKLIRRKTLEEIKTNSVYNILVNQKIVDQKYLFVLQAIGNTLISEQDSVFEIEKGYEDKLQEIPGALKFTVKIIQLDMYGGVPKEILEVYQRYLKAFRISGQMGETIYSAFGSSKTIILTDFTLVEALTVFKYNYPETLDLFYKSVNNDLIRWQGGSSSNYRYQYLNNKTDFNKYLGSVDPNSENYILYDFILTASNLYADYDANEVSADDKYKGKQIAVKGTIIKIAKDIMDNPYITLSTGDFGEIQCSFKKSEVLRKLAKGDDVTVVGTCFGKMSVIIKLTNCRLF